MHPPCTLSAGRLESEWKGEKMKIGVLSDSHDNLPKIRQALKLFREAGAACLVHAGDFVAPFAVRELLQFPGECYGCFGNNDGERAGIRKLWDHVYDPPHMIVVAGRRILLMHAPLKLPDLPAEMRSPDVLISGHTHEMKLEAPAHGPLHLNPGEAGGWTTNHATAALLDSVSLEVRFIDL